MVLGDETKQEFGVLKKDSHHRNFNLLLKPIKAKFEFKNIEIAETADEIARKNTQSLFVIGSEKLKIMRDVYNKDLSKDAKAYLVHIPLKVGNQTYWNTTVRYTESHGVFVISDVRHILEMDMKNLVELKDKLILNEECKFTIFPNQEFIEKVAFYKQGGYGNEFSSEMDHSIEC
jgi:hypothetical protein